LIYVDDEDSDNTHCDYIPDVFPPECAYIDINPDAHRVGGINYKGVLDFWRRPKPIYQIVAGKYNATKNAIFV